MTFGVHERAHISTKEHIFLQFSLCPKTLACANEFLRVLGTPKEPKIEKSVVSSVSSAIPARLLTRSKNPLSFFSDYAYNPEIETED